MRYYSSIIIIALLVNACAPTITTESLKPEGDKATLFLKNNKNYEVELLSITESQICLIYSNKITLVMTSRIESIIIHGYDVTTGQKISGALPALALEAIILLVASSVDQTTWMAIAGLSMVGTLVLWLNAGPKQKYISPFSESDLETLKLYCRYPQGLSDLKWSVLLKFHNQDDFQIIPLK
jgi:hypothetical protein